MDMYVDTKLFDHIRESLGACAGQLRSSADTLQNEVRRAGESLEGRQYSLSVEASNASCEIVSACASNADEVGKYLSRLQSHVDEYIRCKYRG